MLPSRFHAREMQVSHKQTRSYKFLHFIYINRFPRSHVWMSRRWDFPKYLEQAVKCFNRVCCIYVNLFFPSKIVDFRIVVCAWLQKFCWAWYSVWMFKTTNNTFVSFSILSEGTKSSFILSNLTSISSSNVTCVTSVCSESSNFTLVSEVLISCIELFCNRYPLSVLLHFLEGSKRAIFYNFRFLL